MGTFLGVEVTPSQPHLVLHNQPALPVPSDGKFNERVFLSAAATIPLLEKGSGTLLIRGSLIDDEKALTQLWRLQGFCCNWRRRLSRTTIICVFRGLTITCCSQLFPSVNRLLVSIAPPSDLFDYVRALQSCIYHTQLEIHTSDASVLLANFFFCNSSFHHHYRSSPRSASQCDHIACRTMRFRGFAPMHPWQYYSAQISAMCHRLLRPIVDLM